jgi:hypothetical protein
VALLGAVLKKQRFFIGMELGIDGHDPTFHVDHGLDKVTESPLSHMGDVAPKYRAVNDLHQPNVAQAVDSAMPAVTAGAACSHLPPCRD